MIVLFFPVQPHIVEPSLGFNAFLPKEIGFFKGIDFLLWFLEAPLWFSSAWELVMNSRSNLFQTNWWFSSDDEKPRSSVEGGCLGELNRGESSGGFRWEVWFLLDWRWRVEWLLEGGIWLRRWVFSLFFETMNTYPLRGEKSTSMSADFQVSTTMVAWWGRVEDHIEQSCNLRVGFIWIGYVYPETHLHYFYYYYFLLRKKENDIILRCY